ncbi:hypothetical protein HGM15179_008286 [Zosterops borbonicus]|uniref:Uncharacterized protein n=1 Tax=Zosterops borbonicus TaxID=364589 RepID=A0A8K1GIW4_9PASS|nr:hypothetical protein HGM15179_008286 [Zosterops borbonicus]
MPKEGDYGDSREEPFPWSCPPLDPRCDLLPKCSYSLTFTPGQRCDLLPKCCEENVIFLMFQKPFTFDRDKNSIGDYQFSISNTINRQ